MKNLRLKTKRLPKSGLKNFPLDDGMFDMMANFRFKQSKMSARLTNPFPNLQAAVDLRQCLEGPTVKRGHAM